MAPMPQEAGAAIHSLMVARAVVLRPEVALAVAPQVVVPMAQAVAADILVVVDRPGVTRAVVADLITLVLIKLIQQVVRQQTLAL
jgi:hypothetical protein